MIPDAPSGGNTLSPKLATKEVDQLAIDVANVEDTVDLMLAGGDSTGLSYAATVLSPGNTQQQQQLNPLTSQPNPSAIPGNPITPGGGSTKEQGNVVTGDG